MLAPDFMDEVHLHLLVSHFFQGKVHHVVKSQFQNPFGVHSHRITGGNRHHSGPYWTLGSRCAKGARSCQPHEQRQ
jgi:hypothetical protein